MDAPQPPPDEEMRNIIDRLANFVARNGQDFENMTKQKQRDNPKFQFLFGGEYFAYYNYRVTTEQAILKQQAMRQQQQQQYHQTPPNQMNPMPQQGQGLMGNSPFGSPSGQPRASRFGPSLQQQQRFELPQPILNSGPLMGQRFDNESPYHNFDHRMNFERPQGPGGNFQNFDRGQPGNRFPSQMQRFDRAPGNFERYPGPGNRFDNDMPQRPQFNQGVGRQINPQHQLHSGMRTGFEGSPPRRFDIAPQFDQFEKSALPAGLDRNSSSGFQNQIRQPLPLPQTIPSPAPPVVPHVPAVNIEALTAQKKSLEEQISQSGKNLAGQQQVLMTKQQAEVEGTLRQLQDTKISELSSELQVNIDEFGGLLQQVMTSCSKDAIGNARAWIWAHCSTQKHNELISSYLLRRVTDPGTTFHQRLYAIYLVNDTLHHCPRRRLDELQNSLERVLIPMYCFTRCTEGEQDEESLSKLNKLLTIWQGNQNHVSREAVEKLSNFTLSWSEYKNELVANHAAIVTHIASSIQKTFEGYQNQHNLFVQHVSQTVKQIDQQIEDAIVQEQKRKLQEEERIRMHQENARKQQELRLREEEIRQQMLRATQQPPMNPQLQPMGMMPMAQPLLPYPPTSNSQDLDLSRPPPGFNDQQQQVVVPPPVPEIPRLPYFELPAGLMVPLVKPEDDNYKPIDPSLIRLPPPCPPSERLIQALEAFYGPPSHDNPRDSEGWERLGLYEFYKAKNLARKQKEEDIREGRRQKSKSPSPVRREQSPSGRSPPRRRYQSKSPSPTTKRRRSRSKSPRRNRRRRSKSRSRSPARRSVTPPSFGAPVGLGMERVLDESNKGHQLLKKMGWGGSGLGANEQGIEAPVKGGEIRERADQYKGVGVNLNDPFESYRKSKGQAFVERMRARADDRP